MFYVVRFNRQADEFEACGAFSKRSEADDAAMRERDSGSPSVVVIEWQWYEFATFALKTALSFIKEPLSEIVREATSGPAPAPGDLKVLLGDKPGLATADTLGMR